MSENQMQTYIRFKLDNIVDDYSEALRVATLYMGCEPEYEGEIYWEEKADGFVCNYVENYICIDYVYSTDYPSYEIDISIDMESLALIKKAFQNRFKIECEPTIRILQYYNGGSCGLQEFL